MKITLLSDVLGIINAVELMLSAELLIIRSAPLADLIILFLKGSSLLKLESPNIPVELTTNFDFIVNSFLFIYCVICSNPNNFSIIILNLYST